MLPRRTHLPSVGPLFALLLACGLSLTSRARADVAIGVDLDTAVPIKSPADPAGGFGVRLGDQLHAPAIVLTPELAFNYQDFANGEGPTIYRGLVGLRLGVGEIIRPGVFAHVGFGRFDLNTHLRNPSGTAFTYDAGLMLDFTLIPLLNFGVHGAYAVLAGDPDVGRGRFRWIALGVHAELVF